MAEQIWLKKEKDYTIDGDWNYNANNCLLIDTEFDSVNISTPERKILVEDVHGQGAIVTPLTFFKNRTIEITKRFKAKNNYTFHLEKFDFFSNWVFTNDTLYLIRNTETGLQKIKVYPNLKSSERFKNYAISDNIEIQLITEDPFWENIAETSETKDYTNFSNFLITNNGIFTPFRCLYEPSTAGQGITISLLGSDEYISFYNLNFITGDKIFIDFFIFEIFINGIKISPDFSGSPFFLQNGDNYLVIQTAGQGQATISFNERFF